MPVLFLSASLLEDVPAPGPGTERAGPYIVALKGIAALCERHGWQIRHSHQFGASDAATWVKFSNAFVAIRLPGMRGATKANWELSSAIGKTITGVDRPVLVFKIEATTDYDEFWLGRPGTVEIVGNPALLLEQLELVLRG